MSMELRLFSDEEDEEHSNSLRNVIEAEVEDEESGTAGSEAEDQLEIDIDLQNNTNQRKRKIRAPVWDIAVRTDTGANCRFCQKS